MLRAAPRCMACLGLAMALGVGRWGGSWGAVVWVILKKGVFACEEGRGAVTRPLEAAWGPPCPKPG